MAVIAIIVSQDRERSYQFLLPFTIATTYEFFKKTALYGGDYKEDVKQQPSSAEAVQSVANDKFAIGYFGLGYKTEGVRTVPLAAYYGRECYDTTAEATYSGKYPIARYLYIYLNKKPDEPLDPLRAELRPDTNGESRVFPDHQ
jgi:phosphate transport system substrate-binding protein